MGNPISEETVFCTTPVRSCWNLKKKWSRAAEETSSDRTSLGREEDEAVSVRDSVGDLGKFVGDEAGERDCSDRRSRLGRSEADVARQLDERLGDCDLSAQQIYSAPTQGEELAEPETAVTGEQYEPAVPRVDRVSKA